MPLSDLWGGNAGETQESESESEGHGSNSHGHSHSIKDSDSHADSDREEEVAVDDSEFKKLKRRQQTANARVQSLLSRQRSRLLKGVAENLPSQDGTLAFQHKFLKGARTWSLFDNVAAKQQTRTGEGAAESGQRRAVWLYFTGLASALKAFFLGPGPDSAEPAFQSTSTMTLI